MIDQKYTERGRRNLRSNNNNNKKTIMHHDMKKVLWKLLQCVFFRFY